MPSDILVAQERVTCEGGTFKCQAPVVSVSCACRPLHMDAHGVDRNTLCNIPCARSSDRAPARGTTQEQDRYDWRLSAFNI